MKTSLIIFAFFCAGLLMGLANWMPPQWIEADLSLYALYVLMLLVGISVGSDHRSLSAIRRQGARLALVPIITILGTFAGVSLVSIFSDKLGLPEALAVGAGFGYYSLSSVIIGELHSEALGVVALLSNVMREIITLLFAPLMVILLGKLAPIAAAGATSMDTTLPIIVASSGKEYAIVALFHGIVLTLMVPFMVTLILTFL